MYDIFTDDFETFINSWWPYILSICISIIYAIRFYVGGVDCVSRNRIDDKIIIITGSTSGIGLETAKDLISRGGHVILAVRNIDKANKIFEGIKKKNEKFKISVIQLDISDFFSIQSFAKRIIEEYEKIDVLINNAAVIFQPFQKTAEGNELTLVTNYLGPFLLTHLLLPLLNKSTNGRIINVSAVAHFTGKLKLDNLNMEKNFNEKDAFAQSKLALTIFTRYLASLLSKTKITCNSVCPGLVRGTGHLRNIFLNGNKWSKIYLWPWIWLFLKTPKQGSQNIVYLAVEPSLFDITGCYFSDCEIKNPAENVKDVKLAQALYSRSCSIVNINGKKLIDSLICPEKSNNNHDLGDGDNDF